MSPPVAGTALLREVLAQQSGRPGRIADDRGELPMGEVGRVRCGHAPVAVGLTEVSAGLFDGGGQTRRHRPITARPDHTRRLQQRGVHSLRGSVCSLRGSDLSGGSGGLSRASSRRVRNVRITASRFPGRARFVDRFVLGCVCRSAGAGLGRPLVRTVSIWAWWILIWAGRRGCGSLRGRGALEAMTSQWGAVSGVAGL